ncbi:MAG: O-antigen ligase family protein, partial [Rhodospirillales bacterium]
MTDTAIPHGEDTLPDRLKPIRSLFLFLALGMLAPVAVYASNGTVPLLAVGALAGATAALAGGLKQFARSASGVSLILLLSWIVLSLSWSISTDDASWLAFILIALNFVGFVFVTAVMQLEPGRARTAQKILILGTMAMIGLFIAEAVTGGIVLKLLDKPESIIMNTVGRGTTILAVILWPALVLAQTRFRTLLIPAMLLIGAAAAAYLLPVDAAFIAVMAGTIFFFGILYARRIALAVLAAVLALGILSGPWLFLNVLNIGALTEIGIKVPESREHRLSIWQFVAGKIAEKPAFGQGLGAAREIGRAEQQRYEALQARQTDHLSIHEIRLPLHPHNIPLQIWLELGAVGVLLYLGILFGIIRHLW